MTELEQFYNERIKEPGYPEFSELPDDDKAVLERTLLFSFWRMRQAFSDLRKSFCNGKPPSVDFNRGVWKSWAITGPTRFERFCLFFIRKRYEFNETENTTTAYKRFRGKLFIVGFYINPPDHWNCRCSVEAVND